MKKVNIRRAVCPLLAIALAGTFLTSCDKVSKNENPLSEEYEENEALPVTDQLAVTFSGKAAVMGSDRSGFTKNVVNRLEGSTDVISSDAEIIVFTAGYAMDFTDAETKSLLLAYVNGASFVFLDPVFPDMSAFQDKLYTATISIMEEDIEFDVNESQNFYQKIYEMKDACENGRYGSSEVMAFRRNSIYVVRSLEDMAEASDNSATGFFTSADKPEEKDCAETDYTPTDYDYGKSADLLTEWLSDSDNDGGNLQGEESNAIDRYMSGYRVVIQQSVGPSRALDRTMAYELVYTIYSAYDFDNNADYYFIRLEPDFHAKALGCREGDKNWVSAKKVVVFDDGTTSGDFWEDHTDLWYGPYMSKFDYTAKIVRENGDVVNNVTLYSATPYTDVSGSSGYTTGFTVSLNGNIGFNANGPSGGVTAGFSFTESHSHSINDLRLYNRKENNIPHWIIEGIYPQCHIGFLSYYHDQVATFQKNDWQTEFTWVVSIPNPQRDQAYYVSATDITEISELNHSLYDYELRVHPTQTTTIRLCEPNRSNEKYIMYCSDDDVQKLVSGQFSDTWYNSFTYYSLDRDRSYWGARAMFDKVMVAVKGYASTLKAKGYTGKYTFTLATVDGTELKSFTIDNSTDTE